MNKMLILTQVLFKNGSLISQAGSRRRNIALLIGAIAVLPLLAVETMMMWKAYDFFMPLHLTGAVLAGLFTAACAAMVLLSIFYVISTYYFADDVAQILTMPIQPHQLLTAKFFIVMLFQYALELLIVLPGIVVIGIRNGNFFYWFNAIFIFALLPLIPTAICSIISILLMAFGKFFRNKDRVKLISGLLAIVLALGLSVVMQFLIGRPSSMRMLLDNSVLTKQAAALFPSNLLAIKAILGGTAGSLLWLALFLLISVAAVVAFLLLGSQLYLIGVVGLTQSVVHKTHTAVCLHAKKHPAALSIAFKDLRMLCRTPAYALNCMLSAILVPIILVMSFAFTLQGMKIPHANAFTIALGVLFLTFTSMMNMVSPTAISRDGQDAIVAQFIPIPYRVQLLGKLLPGLGLSIAAMLITVIPVVVLFGPDSLTVMATSGLCMLSLVTFNLFGLFVDVVFPKLDWDDETIAVKRNFNVAIEMVVMIIALALPAFLVYKLQMSLHDGFIFLLCYDLMLLAFAIWLLFWKSLAYYGVGLNDKETEKNRSFQKIIRNTVSAVIIVVALGLIGWEFLFVQTDVKIVASKVNISAGFGESSSFTLTQIKTVYLQKTLPSVSGKIGFESGALKRGSFIVEGLGRGHIYTQNSKGPFLFVMLKDGSFTIFNFDDNNKLYVLYNTFKKYSLRHK